MEKTSLTSFTVPDLVLYDAGVTVHHEMLIAQHVQGDPAHVQPVQTVLHSSKINKLRIVTVYDAKYTSMNRTLQN